jgi:hypothetical protein
MSDDPIREASVTVLEQLLTADAMPTSMGDLVRIVEDEVITKDAIRELKDEGLVQEADGLFWLTRPARRFAVLQGLLVES